MLRSLCLSGLRLALAYDITALYCADTHVPRRVLPAYALRLQGYDLGSRLIRATSAARICDDRITSLPLASQDPNR